MIVLQGKEKKKKCDESDEDTDKKMTFGRYLSKAVHENDDVSPSRHVLVNPREAAREINLLPRVPAVVDEPPVRVRARGGKIVLAAGAKEEFDNKGNSKLGLCPMSDPASCLSTWVDQNENQVRRLGASAVTSESLAVVERASAELASNSAELLRFMEMQRYPEESRTFMNEVAFDLKESVEKERPRMGRELIDHAVEYAIKIGLLAGSIKTVKKSYKKADNVRAGPPHKGGGASSSSSSTSEGQFEWNPKKHNKQQERAGKFVCYFCANALLKAGEVQVGDDLPDWVFFPSFNAVNAHKKKRQCGKKPN